jgi:hypothetical protein
MTEPLATLVSTVALLLLAWFVLYKSPLSRLWWMPLSPLLHRLGFRLVVMDMSFGIHAVRWRREWVGGVQRVDDE